MFNTTRQTTTARRISYPSIEHHHYHTVVIKSKPSKRARRSKKQGRLSSGSTSNSSMVIKIVSPLFAPPPLLSGLQPGEIPVYHDKDLVLLSILFIKIGYYCTLFPFIYITMHMLKFILNHTKS